MDREHWDLTINRAKRSLLIAALFRKKHCPLSLTFFPATKWNVSGRSLLRTSNIAFFFFPFFLFVPNKRTHSERALYYVTEFYWLNRFPLRVSSNAHARTPWNKRDPIGRVFGIRFWQKWIFWRRFNWRLWWSITRQRSVISTNKWLTWQMINRGINKI